MNRTGMLACNATESEISDSFAHHGFPFNTRSTTIGTAMRPPSLRTDYPGLVRKYPDSA